MKKCILSLVLVIIILISCFYIKMNKYKFFVPAVEKEFYQAVSKFRESGTEKILLKELTNFEWDKVCYIGAYSYIPNNIVKNYKFNKWVPHQDTDGMELIIFLNQNKNTGFVFFANKAGIDREKPEDEYCSGIESSYLRSVKGKFPLILVKDIKL